MPEKTEIRIEAPLPLDMVATITRLIGGAYPNAQMAPSGRQNCLTFVVEAADRVPEDKVAEFLHTFTPEFADETLGEVTYNLDTYGAPLILAQTLREAALRTINENPEAENYLEYSFWAPEERREYVVTIARGANRTPAALREQAEERADKYAAKLLELGVDPTTL